MKLIAERIKGNKAFWIAIFCIFTYANSILHFIPIYFTSVYLKPGFYTIIFVVFFITVIQLTYKSVYASEKHNTHVSAFAASILTGFATFIIFGFWTMSLLFCFWKSSGTLYVNKNFQSVRIVKWYGDSGAFGGGTSPEDFQDMLFVPLPPYFAIATPVNTSAINKDNWTKPTGGH